MQTILFHSTIFGPIHSRRLGSSLGVNLSPIDGKICSFDCLYCEAGFNAQGTGKSGFPSRDSVKQQLEAKLSAMKSCGEKLDVITFSGNGEPTLHPDFPEIVADTIHLRDIYFPNVKISVLSNSTMIDRPEVCKALKSVDNNILKLDSAIENTMQAIDRPNSPSFTVERVMEHLKQFTGQCIIQTMLVRGEWNGKSFDNTTPDEVAALIEAYKRIKPRSIMIYSLDRATPATTLKKVPAQEMEIIANKIREAGFDVTVS